MLCNNVNKDNKEISIFVNVLALSKLLIFYLNFN